MTTLLESKARPYGSRKGTAISVALHVGLIGAAVVASGKAALPEREEIEEHAILYVAPPPPKVYVAPDPLPEVKRPAAPKKEASRPAPPRVRTPAPPRRVATPTPRPAAPQALVPAAPIVAPINVPTSIPKVDVNAVPTGDIRIEAPDPAKLVASATGGGSSRSNTSNGDVDVDGASRGGRGGLGSGVDPNRAYNENQVERTVQVTRAAQPRYPDALRSVSVQGQVMVQYIVDARGRVEPGSIKILSASHKLFSDAVRAALLDARFRPAEVGGKPVRQLVEQPFYFKLDG